MAMCYFSLCIFVLIVCRSFYIDKGQDVCLVVCLSALRISRNFNVRCAVNSSIHQHVTICTSNSIYVLCVMPYIKGIMEYIIKCFLTGFSSERIQTSGIQLECVHHHCLHNACPDWCPMTGQLKACPSHLIRRCICLHLLLRFYPLRYFTFSLSPLYMKHLEPLG